MNERREKGPPPIFNLGIYDVQFGELTTKRYLEMKEPTVGG